MKKFETVLEGMLVALDLALALLCALNALVALAGEGKKRLYAGILWITASGAWLACGVADMIRQGRLIVELLEDDEIEAEDAE